MSREKRSSGVQPKGLQIVAYYLSNDALYAWVINHNSIEAVKKDVSLQKIADLIKSFRNSIFTQTMKRGVTVIEKPVDSKGNEHRELYEILFHPIEEHLSGNRVIIIPYGILNYLPFQALHEGNQYLVEKYSISNTNEVRYLLFYPESLSSFIGSPSLEILTIFEEPLI